MNFQLISNTYLFPHQLAVLASQFGGKRYKTITPGEITDGDFGALDAKIPVVIGTVSMELANELLEAGFSVWVAQRSYPRSVTRPWEKRTVLTGYVPL